MPAVTIVIPAYNPGNYLAEALNSVMAQTFTDWELIVVDDGSPEDVSSITNRYDQVKLIRQENAGQSVARNVGIAHASGEFIAFLDQDDIWMPTKLEKQLSVMRSNCDIGMCHTQFTIVDRFTNKLSDGFGRQQSYQEMLTGSGICGASTVLLRRIVLLHCGMFDPMYDPAEDYDLWLRIARRYATAFVDSSEVLYRQHEKNQSLSYRKTYTTIRAILHKHAAIGSVRGQNDVLSAVKVGMQQIRPTYGAQAFDHARDCLRKKQLRLFREHLAFAFLNAPQYTSRSILTYLRLAKA